MQHHDQSASHRDAGVEVGEVGRGAGGHWLTDLQTSQRVWLDAVVEDAADMRLAANPKTIGQEKRILESSSASSVPLAKSSLGACENSTEVVVPVPMASSVPSRTAA